MLPSSISRLILCCLSVSSLFVVVWCWAGHTVAAGEESTEGAARSGEAAGAGEGPQREEAGQLDAEVHAGSRPGADKGA